MDGLYLDTTIICNSDHTTSPQFSFSWNLQGEAVLITILDFMELGIQHTTICVCVCVCARARVHARTRGCWGAGFLAWHKEGKSPKKSWG